MSHLSTVREGIRDNPIRALVFARAVLVVVAGGTLALDSAWRLAQHARDSAPPIITLELGRPVVFLGLALIGVVAEFTSYRVARLVNLAFYTGYAIWLWFVPVHLASELLWYVASAVVVVALWGLYLATSPQRLSSADAA